MRSIIRIIAILMMSAAVPWIGILMAALSAPARTLKFRDVMSGRYLRRPRTVSTYPRARHLSLVSSVYLRMWGYFSKYKSMNLWPWSGVRSV